jgi:hypothetical protein
MNQHSDLPISAISVRTPDLEAISHTVTTMLNEEKEEKYHPDFSFEDADICIVSKDKVNFPMPSILLRRSSSLFRTTLSLPQPQDLEGAEGRSGLHNPGGASATSIPRMHLDEESPILELALRLISFKEMPPLRSIDVIEELLQVLDKYDIPSASYVVRNILVQERLLSASALRVYIIACRYGWEEEKKLAASSTLKGDPFSSQYLASKHLLKRLDSGDLLDLLYLHIRHKGKIEW